MIWNEKIVLGHHTHTLLPHRDYLLAGWLACLLACCLAGRHGSHFFSIGDPFFFTSRTQQNFFPPWRVHLYILRWKDTPLVPRQGRICEGCNLYILRWKDTPLVPREGCICEGCICIYYDGRTLLWSYTGALHGRTQQNFFPLWRVYLYILRWKDTPLVIHRSATL